MLERLTVHRSHRGIRHGYPGTHRVTIREGDRTEEIPTRTILWAAGVLGSPLGRILAKETGAPVDKAGRILVELRTLRCRGIPEIFVIGDLANFSHQTGKPSSRRRAARHSGRAVRGETDRTVDCEAARTPGRFTTLTKGISRRLGEAPQWPILTGCGYRGCPRG